MIHNQKCISVLKGYQGWRSSNAKTKRRQAGRQEELAIRHLLHFAWHFSRQVAIYPYSVSKIRTPHHSNCVRHSLSPIYTATTAKFSLVNYNNGDDDGAVTVITFREGISLLHRCTYRKTSNNPQAHRDTRVSSI